ncbi:APC family permease [Burkholderia guangdongensis]|uniref:APC family permease n=1 Tax=Burkholderia guangdongensis TaxID=1792500 RepID=UPI0015C738F6|nr:APC family permease [Burkholderia guangdongensis]
MSIEEFGYTQELKRALRFKDLVVYGLVWMIPIAPFGIYGYVSDAANGMVALAYAIGVVAMFFTAMSYKAMSADFPLAGSVYTYAQRGIGEAAGFLSGWLILLDYILIPSLLYIASAAALAPLFPAVPKWLWVVGFAACGAGVNLCGVEITAKASRLMLYAQLVVLAIFCAVGLYALYVRGIGAGHLTLDPLFQPSKFNVGVIFSAVSVAALSFLGFDAISTMSEEVSDDDRQVVGRATLVSLLLVGGLFILQTWIAADLAHGMKFASLDTAFYETAERAGGHWLNLLTSWSTAIAWGIANSLVSTASIARILYSMARDRKLPAVLARVSGKSRVPYVSIVLVGVVSLVVSTVFIDRLDQITSFVNFGALTGFLMLHASVVNHFIVRKKSTQYVQHLLFPVAGFAILAYVLYSMGRATWMLGLIWLAVGVVYYVVLTQVLRRNAQLQV